MSSISSTSSCSSYTSNSISPSSNSNNEDEFSIFNILRLQPNLSKQQCQTLMDVFMYYNEYSIIDTPRLKHQIFRYNVPYKLVYAFIILNCDIENGIYTHNRNTFKRSKVNGSLKYLCSIIKPCYHISKQKYVDKTNTFKGFTTVLRQLCKLHSISYTHYEKFFRSNHDVHYSIMLPVIQNDETQSIENVFHISNLEEYDDELKV